MKQSRWVIAAALMVPLFGCAANVEETDLSKQVSTDGQTAGDAVRDNESNTENAAETSEEAASTTSPDETDANNSSEENTSTSGSADEEVQSEDSSTEETDGGVTNESDTSTSSTSPESEDGQEAASTEDEQPPAPSSTEADLGLGTLVVVNKQLGLERGYRPSDLVEPNISFVSSAAGERRTMRREAAGAIEGLFAAAAADGIDIKATSAFRSYEYQEVLFNAYVKRDGKEAALRYSAPPGHSEHQTGLAIDVSGGSVGYELTQQLGAMAEGKWLASNAHRFGFIVRYEQAFEAQTGYMYEPWHLRYVGKTAAANIVGQHIWLERYMGF